VPGGGLTGQGRWKTARGKDKYLFSVLAMSLVFRAKYVQVLKEKIPGLDISLIACSKNSGWYMPNRHLEHCLMVAVRVFVKLQDRRWLHAYF
jgi:hypothetical protein